MSKDPPEIPTAPVRQEEHAAARAPGPTGCAGLPPRHPRGGGAGGFPAPHAYNAKDLTGITFSLGGNTLGTLTYTTDGDGRRTLVGGTWARTTLPVAITGATYNANNQQTAVGSTTLTYDLNGNLTADGATTYTWDARDRLTATSASNATFQYDPLGRRTQKVISGITARFLYDGVNPVQELDAVGSVLANLLTGLGIDEIFTRTDRVSTRSLLSDALNSTLALADNAGILQTTYTYEPFGGATVTGESNTNSYQFTGRENDGTGLDYYRARYYSASRQRFLSEDPIGFAGGDTNLYAYVRNAPLSFMDPLGLCRDPGGSGIRYCIDAYIPHATVLLFGKGDWRGPEANGDGTFRTRQLISADGSQRPQAGVSETWIPGIPGRPGSLGDCNVSVTAIPFGGRKIRARCSGTNGFNMPPRPLAYDFTIRENADGSAEIVSAYGTRFPSFEIWQYGDRGNPRPVYLYNTSGSVWDLYRGMGPLPAK